jgi:Ca-activated chloride channel family protein
MTTPLRAWISASLALSLGCGSASAVGPGGSNGALALQGGADDPPHVFTARTHPARIRPAPVAPDLTAMPRLVERSAACYGGVADDPGPAPLKKAKSKRKGGGGVATKKSGFVPYNPSPGAASPKAPATPTATKSTTKPSKPVVTPSATPVAPSAAGGMAVADEAEQRTEDLRPEPASAPPADMGVAAEKRESRRERRRDKDAANGDRALAPSQPAAEPAPIAIAPNPDDQFSDWGRATYLSNDDSMSLSSAQRVIYAIDRFLPLPIEHIRPHELLNYFSFTTAPVPETDDFSVSAELAPDPNKPGIYNLALAVAGRPLDRESRRNAAVTFVVDRSGSMSDEGRMEYLKQGLRRMLDELKTGDMVHLVLFDDQVCTPVENFVVGRDPRRMLEAAIEKIQPRGSTDVNLGLQTGYAIADRTFQPNASNRVVLVTDALANTGVTDEESIALIGKHYDARRIRLSGIGVGSEFNDSLLDKLTERGHGAYVFLGSPAEVDAVFGRRFVSLVETVADDVHFQLQLPPSLRMNVFYGEESSSVKEDVQAIHYFANTSQLFLADLMARGGRMRPQDSIMLTIEYDDPETGDAMVEEFAFGLGDIAGAGAPGRNLAKGRMLIHFIDGLAAMATRPLPSSWSTTRESWTDPDAFAMCQQGRDDLAKMSSTIADDPEVTRVTSLWDRYCTRFSRPNGAVRRASPENGWPAAR